MTDQDDWITPSSQSQGADDWITPPSIPEEKPSVIQDIGKSGASGLGKTASYLMNPMGIVRDAGNAVVGGATRLAGAGYEALGGELSPSAAEYLTYPLGNPDKDLMTIAQKGVQKAIGADYQPKTPYGQATQIAVQSLPFVANGEGAINTLTRAAGIGIGSAAGSEAAKQMGFGEKGQQVGGVLGGSIGATTPEAIEGMAEGEENPMLAPKPAPFDAEATHSAISDSYGAAKAATQPYYDLMRNIATGEKAQAGELKPALESMIDDIQNTPFHEATSELSYLKQQAAKIGEDGNIPLNDMVKLKQNLNANFNPKRFAQGSDTPYANVGKLVDDSLDDAATRIPEFAEAKTLADKNWLNTVKSPFEDNSVLQKFWKPEDYYAKKSVDNGMLEELPDPTKQRAASMVEKIKTPVQLNAVRRVLPQDLADSLSQAKIQSITQGEGAGRLGAAGQVLTKGLDLTPSGIANTFRNIGNVIKPRYSAAEQDLLEAAGSPSPTLSTRYTKPFQQLKAAQQQMEDSAGEMQPMNYGAKPILSFMPDEPEFDSNAPMVKSLSPEERLAAQANVMGNAVKNRSPLKMQKVQGLAALKNMSDLSAAAPLKDISQIAPSTLSDSLAREQVLQGNEEVQSLLKQGYSLKQIKELGYKKGGVVNTNPSEAQKRAGNYAKEKMNIHGLPITIENPKGSLRSGKDKNGKEWRIRMPTAYGYINKTLGADNDHVDCYIGPNPDSKRVWILDQKDADSGNFDEHKCFIGFKSKPQVLAIYRKAFSDGKADKRIHAITEVTLEQLKEWLNKDMKRAA